VWAYDFRWAQQPAPWNTIYGAAHAFDLPFLLGNFGPSLFANVTNSTANRPGRLALSGAMMASLGAFARTGDPNHAGLGRTWQAWPSRLVFDATQTQAVIGAQ
jgi:para-nitrobenzyl esterase